MIDFTTVLACDDRYLPLLALTWQTWKKHRPELFTRPLRVMYACEMDRSKLDFVVKEHPDVELIAMLRAEADTFTGGRIHRHEALFLEAAHRIEALISPGVRSAAGMFNQLEQNSQFANRDA